MTEALPPAAQFAQMLLVVTSLFVCVVAVRRLALGQPLVAYQPRQQVPWTFADLASAFAVFIIAITIAVAFLLEPDQIGDLSSSQPATNGETDASPNDSSTASVTSRDETPIDASTVDEDAEPSPTEPQRRKVDPSDETDNSDNSDNSDESDESDESGTRNAPETADQELESQPHPIVAVLESRPGVATLILCAIAAAVVAPIGEEMAFRLFFQGWLEANERVWRPLGSVSAFLPTGTVPILISSFLFAAIHYRPPGEVAIDVERIIPLLIADSSAKLLAGCFACVFVVWRVGATRADLGIDPQRIGSDVALGLVAFCGVLAPIYAAQAVLPNFLPTGVAPDPFSLFPLALVLGYLYFRTHRIVASIVVHFCVNTLALVGTWITAGSA